MKRLFVLLSCCLFTLCGCNHLDDMDATTAFGAQIMLSPETPLVRDGIQQEYSMSIVNVDKEGGEATVFAYYPEEGGVPLNDKYMVMMSDWDIPSGQVVVNREKINDFKTAYHLKIEPNVLGKLYSIVITITDYSRKDSYGRAIESKATIVVNQAN